MKKILVTTDFSANSKAAIRFAIQVASQWEVSLTFLHVQHVMRMTSWNEATHAAYEKNEVAKARKTLDDFIESIYETLKISPQNYTCVIHNSPFVDSTIMDYAADRAFDFICISARGAGMVEKLFGTTTANLINQSTVPIIAVPGNYRADKVASILYASDLSDLKFQLTRVVDFARPLGATVELIHFSGLSEPVTDPEIIGMDVQKFTDYPVEVQLKPRDLSVTLADDIESAINVRKPSMLIMFTKQNEGFFARLFLSGNSVDCLFLTTVPLLVFSQT